MSGDAEGFIQTCLMNLMRDKPNITKITAVNVEDDSSRHNEGSFSKHKYLTATAETKYKLIVKLGREGTNSVPRTLIRSVYKRAILLYTEIIPKFVQFESDKGIEAPFDNVPKCYGAYMDDNNEMIVQGDLAEDGYTIIPQLEPVEHAKLEVLLKTFGRWHAISAAMAIQQPDNYQKIAEKLDHANEINQPLIDRMVDVVGIYVRNMQLICINLLGNQMLIGESAKWETLQNRVADMVNRANHNNDPFKVIIHGDIQPSHFMFKDSKPAILDWKCASRNSPVYDIADLIYTCASRQDLMNLKELLVIYHESFTTHLRKLGISEPSYVYSMADLIRDWRNIAEYSIMRSFTIMKNTFSLPLSCNAEYDENSPVWRNLPKPTQWDYQPTPEFHVPMYHLRMLAERSLHIFRSAIFHGFV